jgi:hypothetical protein
MDNNSIANEAIRVYPQNVTPLLPISDNLSHHITRISSNNSAQMPANCRANAADNYHANNATYPP